MSHPKNKKERFLIGKRKGLKRVSLWYMNGYTKEKRKELEEEGSRAYRNSTKTCSCYMCRNPRRNSWAPKKERITIQERKQNERDKFDLDDILE